jgi:integrase
MHERNFSDLTIDGDIMRFRNPKNYGYGRSLAFAAKTALREMYGGGHYSSVASHCARWRKFIAFVRGSGISDARQINQMTLDAFLDQLKAQVIDGTLAVSYAVNIVSSINSVLLALRGNKKIWIRPSLVGSVSAIRTRVPGFINHGQAIAILKRIEDAGDSDVAALIRLGGDCGLRLKEAGLFNAKAAVHSTHRTGQISVVKGTKGGQQRNVPIKTEAQLSAIDYAKSRQTGANFVPRGDSYISFRRRIYRKFKKLGISGDFSFRELRASFACHEYHRLTGYLAPVLGGAAPQNVDKEARLQIAEQLGHHRTGICASYFGQLSK